jgi:DNA-binding PadR family transcriptional regulator
MPTTSTLEMAILGLLGGKPQSGYDLRKTFTTTAMRNYSDSPGSIYPALRRLEKRGLIRQVSLPGWQDARGRQDFTLTDEGRAVFVAWLEQQVSPLDVNERLAELLLRFAFMDGNLPRSTTVRFLDQLIEGLTARVDQMHVQFRDMSCKVPPLHTGLLAFESGIKGMEAQLAWAQGARARLAGQ